MTTPATLATNLRGAALMTASMAAFTLNDTFIKALTGNLPLMQAIFLRGVMVSPLLVGLAVVTNGARLGVEKRDWPLVGLRTLAEVGAAYFFLTALFNMPIANAVAILQALPLVITLAGALFLGERVGWRRWSAILVGFVGVLMIVQPGSDGFSVYSIYALIAVAMVTVRDLAARRLSARTPSMTVATIAAVAVAALGGIGALGQEWHPVSGTSLTMLAGASVAILAGYVLSVRVMRVGDIAFVSPFRYTGLLWAMAAGLAVFGDFPDGPTLIGAGIVVATGLFTFLRERKLARDATLRSPLSPTVDSTPDSL